MPLSFSYLKPDTSYQHVVTSICQHLGCRPTTDIFASVVITDVLMMPSIYMIPGVQLFWFDTPAYRVNSLFFMERHRKYILANTRWTASTLYRSYGVNADVLPYPITPPDLELLPPAEKEGFVSVGRNHLFDRKNMGLLHTVFQEMNLRRYLTLVTNESFADIRTTYSLQNKWELFRRAKFYVAMSRVEGQGLPPIEAMAMGTPVIYLNAHAFRELYTDKIGIPVEPSGYEDVNIKFDIYSAVFRVWNVEKKDLIDAINTAISMKNEEYEDMAIRAREFAIRNFHIKNLKGKIEDYIYAVFQKSIFS